ncbi:dicarboxylate/amino acid:cation symporter [Aeromonas cavernicola]|uniref:Dicarboxylate/amino acid:cation symporter n=1 Tax=Aeromonas cavernicola TaxID=1006623 RepID=A0A2H9U6U2_9GAMM|nr:dicarboxylate/amino acid:cation symporter [Aeromonas cavernicola]PJG59714.1 dicarboxylate/amino acid:cation symporter [Aeromonas cavernicola]
MLSQGLLIRLCRLWTCRPLWLKTLLGMSVGIGVGLTFGEQAQWVRPIGIYFVSAIQGLMIPLVFCSIITGTTSLLKSKKLDRVGGKAIGLYLLSTALAIGIGLMMGWLLEPGSGAGLGAYQQPTPLAPAMLIDEDASRALASQNWSIAGDKILPIIIFAIALAFSLNASGRRGRPAILFFASLAEGMFKLLQMIMVLAPYGVCALMAWMVSIHGLELLLPLLKVIGVLYLGCILHVFGVYTLMLLLLARLNPIHYFKSIVDAQAVAFTSSSSMTTLPTCLACAERRLGVCHVITEKVLAIGAVFNMDGTALYQGVAALFVAQAFGVDLQFGDYVTIVIIATLASIGTVGTPGAGLLLLSLTLAAVGIPLEGVALLAGIDRLLDMARTTVNVSGDIVVSVLVAQSEKGLDVVVYSDVSAGEDIDFTVR